MGRLNFILAILSCAACESPVDAEWPVGQFAEHLNVRVPELMEDYDVPGVSMALVREGELVWVGAYGLADREAEKRVRLDTVFRAESISKSVTAWGVMKLVEQGRIDLDAPVETYLESWRFPESEFDTRGITPRRLLSANAGLPLGPIGLEYAPGAARPSLREALTATATPIREPGRGFMYSNTGFNLLELLVEEVSGREFAAYMDEEVLGPLGMERASFAWREDLGAAMATGYDLKGNAVPPYVYAEKASGGLLATARDIARFASAGMRSVAGPGGGVLSAGSVDRMHTPAVEIPGLFGVVADHYGFGHFIETLSNGKRAVWHGGQGHGWMTHFHAVPASGDAIVILTNSQRSWPVMAGVLADWSRWSGFEPVKMARITHGVMVLRVLIGLMLLASLGLAYRIGKGLRRGTLKLAPLAREARTRRLAQALLGETVILALAWAAAQPYLMVTSVFPGVAGQAGWALGLLAVLVIASAFYSNAVESSLS